MRIAFALIVLVGCSGSRAPAVVTSATPPPASTGVVAAPSALTPASASALAAVSATAPTLPAPEAQGGPLAPIDVRVVATGLAGAWSVDGAVLALTEAPSGARRLARLDGDQLTDSALLSTGLPEVRSFGRMDGELEADSVGGVIGRYPDALELGVTWHGGFGSTVFYRFDPARGWSEDAGAVLPFGESSLGFVVDPGFGVGVGALYARVNSVGDGAMSPNFVLFLGGRALPLNVYAGSKRVPLSFDRNLGGVFVTPQATLWTLTDESERSRGVLRKNGVEVPMKLDAPAADWLDGPLFVGRKGDIVATIAGSGDMQTNLPPKRLRGA